MDDFEIEWGATRDESMPLRAGGFTRTKVYTFWIGKHGPFVERIPIENFDPLAAGRRAEELRNHLRALPR